MDVAVKMKTGSEIVLPLSLVHTYHLCTVTFVAPILFRPDISTAAPDSKMCEVSKSQEVYENHGNITLIR